VRVIARLLILFALLTAAPSWAQQSTFQLNDDGEWVQVAEPEPGSDEAVIAEARRYIANGKPKRAKKLLNTWIEANEFTNSPWLPDAYLTRGDAKAAAGNEYKALYDYELVIKEYPASTAFPKAVERELEIAIKYVRGMKRKFWGMRITSGSNTGEELLTRVAERMVGSELAERALIELADYYYRERDMDMAAQAYEIFIELHPQSEYLKKAMQRRIYANIARFKGPRYDASGLIEAKFLIQEFARRYPADAERAGLTNALESRLDESAAAQLLETARWYLKRDDPVSARFMLRRLQRRFPLTNAAETGYQILLDRGWVEQVESDGEPGDNEGGEQLPEVAR
jgi:outer membrane protein assembly factor BamD (BamD/ComL family)